MAKAAGRVTAWVFPEEGWLSLPFLLFTKTGEGLALAPGPDFQILFEDNREGVVGSVDGQVKAGGTHYPECRRDV
jgi:hypothetical protein